MSSRVFAPKATHPLEFSRCAVRFGCQADAQMAKEHPSILDDLVEQALQWEGNALDVDYDGDFDEVCVIRGAVGFGIARFERSTPKARALRQELCALARKQRHVRIGARQYVLACRVRDSFGEDAFRVDIRGV